MHFLKTLHYRTETPKQLSFLDYTDRFVGADAEYILNFTSNVIKITKDGKSYFFKEAKERRSSLRECVYNAVECFFDEIADSRDLKKKTLEALKIKRCFNRLVGMGYKDVKGDRFNRYLITGDESWLGLPSPADEAERATLRKLVFYIYGEVENWFYNINLKKGQLQTYSAVRALGTQELARMLGIDSLIPRSDFVKIELLGKVRYGVLSEEAAGDTLTSVTPSERAHSVTPELLRALTNLNLLDALTGDNDHRIGNYHVAKNELRKYYAVFSFDNDSPDTFKLSSSVRRSNLIGCSPFVGKDGLINRAHFDADAATALLQIKKADLKARLPYLGMMQQSFLWGRVRKIQNAITKTVGSRGDFLVSPTDWRMEHVNSDLSPRYGKTYLASLLSDCYFESGLHDFDTLE